MKDFRVGRYDMSELRKFFENLPEDKYTPGGFRFRRLSDFKVTPKYFFGIEAGYELENKPGTIMQPEEVNGFLGNVTRQYEKLEHDLVEHPVFKGMVDKFLDLTKWKGDFSVHQIRIIGKPGETTFPAPEGPHSDGYIWTVPFVLGPVNVTGGEFEVYDNTGKLILWADLESNYGLFKDQEVKHYANPIELIDESKPGHWDVFVFTAGELQSTQSIR